MSLLAPLEALKSRPDDETTFTPKAPGSFERGACNVQQWIDTESAGKHGESALFPPERNRYHVFVNYGCGWCHQVLLVRALRGLQESVSVTHVGCYRGTHIAPRGSPDYPGYMIPAGADKSSGCNFTCMREVYNAFDGQYGVDQLTIPVLFDKQTKRVVSNDPAQILLMLDHWAETLGGNSADNTLYPKDLQTQIEEVNAVVFPGVNNGVYCAWFGGTTDSPAFEEGFELVQNGLKWIEARLTQNGPEKPFLCATTRPTLADVRAFPHLFRFDGIYWELMMRSRGAKIFSSDFPLLAAWFRRMFEAVPGVKESCDLQVATRFYFSDLPVEQSDEIYDKKQAETGGWLPTREEWTQKRSGEGFTAEMVDIPSRI